MPQAKSIVALILLSLFSFYGISQPKPADEIKRMNSPAVALAPLRFLASDELMGRATLRPEINVAARYIAEQFRSMGLKEVDGTRSYFQQFEIKAFVPGQGAFTVNEKRYELGDNLLYLRGSEDVQLKAPVIFAGYGTEADFKNLDVKGKIVITSMGLNDSTSADGLRYVNTKRKMAADKGAVALIERYKKGNLAWDVLRGTFEGERLKRSESVSLPVFMIRDEQNNLSSVLSSGTSASINVSENKIRTVPARNVMGWVEGTDASMKNEFIVLSSHYDHIGIASQPKVEEGKLDSIYNGARDNAVGTAAVINAARYFAQHPAKRSILFIAFTGEEIGLIGSQYFADHPTIPLKQLVYNLNVDNASYNDTTVVTVVALGRTSAEEDIKRGCSAFGLTAISESVLKVNLFEGSDNFNLAKKGVPAPTFSLGMRKFDDDIRSKYHQLSDEVGNLNLSYVLKFMNAYVLAAKYIADNKSQPTWIKGDKYESAWQGLYRP
jgi:hypothetical protein